MLVVRVDGRIVGSIIATFDGWRGIMYRLAVHPDHRRQQLATRLREAAEQTFARWGVRRAIAIVDASHPVAVSFWTRSG